MSLRFCRTRFEDSPRIFTFAEIAEMSEVTVTAAKTWRLQMLRDGIDVQRIGPIYAVTGSELNRWRRILLREEPVT